MRLGVFVESDISFGALYSPQIIRIKGLGRHGLCLKFTLDSLMIEGICAQHELDFWELYKT